MLMVHPHAQWELFITRKATKIFIFERKLMLKKLFILLIAIILVIATFPVFDMSFSFGIDPSLQWLFHHIAEQGFDKARNIIFPYGPLNFLMYPIYLNPLPAIIMRILLSFALILFLFRLMKPSKPLHYLLPSIFSFVILFIAGFNLLLFTVIALLYLLYFKERKHYYLLTVLLLTSLSVFIKINVGILTGGLSAAVILYDLITKKNYRSFIVNLFFITIALFTLWIIMFQRATGFINYFTGLMHLAAGNSSATSLYPDNNAIFLSLAILLIILSVFLNDKKNARLFALIFVLPFFAAWKHGIGRQDAHHFIQFVHFVIIVSILLYTFIDTRRIAGILSSVFGIFFLYMNFMAISYHGLPEIKLNGPENFYSLITDYKNLKDKAKIESNKHININKLPKNIKDIIKNNKVDIYPWDYSIIAANQLSWTPRPILQSFLGYTPWLDEKNKKHFNSSEAPEYIIWHYNRFRSSVNSTRMESVDIRYLLNDEPQTMMALLTYYCLEEKEEDFLLFRKRDSKLESKTHILDEGIIRWNEWINISSVHEHEHDFLRIRAEFSRNLPGKAINFIYKDVRYFMVIETEEGRYYKFRLIKANSPEGIWLDPLIVDPVNDYCPPDIRRVMFITDDRRRVKENIQYSIQSFAFENTGRTDYLQLPAEFFGKDNCLEHAYIYRDETSFSAEKKSVPPRKNSPSLKYKTDSMTVEDVYFEISGFVVPKRNPEAILVMEIFSDGERILWDSRSFPESKGHEKDPSLIQISRKVKIPASKPVEMKGYYWNAGKDTVEVKDLSISIFEASKH